ncbi:MAG: hypothetical protein C0592_00280 [Marinilabiliales bacterium]|nr:MAG: hypothetical protein C0592_00280 [Marinilabiliales bacterium]
MRYLLGFLTFSFLLLSVMVNAQKAVAVYETFDSGIIPSSWSVEDTLSDNYTWEVVSAYQTNTLNGTPFAFVNSDAAGAVDLSEKLVSPAYNVSSYTSVILEFDQYFNEFGGGGTEVGDVDVWNGSQWVNVYSVDADSGNWSSPDHQVLDVTAHKNAAFKVRFWYHGANNDYYWAIDNVKIWDPQLNDVGISVLAGPVSDFEMTATENVSVMVTNFGTQAQTSIPVSFQVNGGTVVNETLDNLYGGFTSLAPGDTFQYTFTATADLSAYGNYIFKCWTGLGTDTDPVNDTLTKNVVNTQTYVQLEADSVLDGILGIETDGNYFYASYWTTPGLFAKFSLTGELVDTFSVPGLTVGIRDMAYDPVSGHFFGGAGTPHMYELHLDTVNPTLINTIGTPSGAMVRYIAYDDTRDEFWLGNLTGDIYLVDKSGSLSTESGIVNPILNADLTGLENRYGLAYDSWSCPGEYLWVFCRPGSPSDVYLAEVDIYTGQPTGRSFDLANQLSFSGATPGAGGLFTHENIIGTTVSIGGIVLTANSIAGYSGELFLLDLETMHPDPSLNVVSQFPANASVDVQLNHKVIVKFDQDISIVSTGGIVITDGSTPVSGISAVVSNDSLIISHADFAGNTQYTVTIPQGTVEWECSENEELVWSFTTGTVSVDELTYEMPSVYPNPARNALTVVSADGQVLNIMDITGKTVMRYEVISNKQVMDISNLKNGIYILQFSSDESVYSIKLIKQ